MVNVTEDTSVIANVQRGYLKDVEIMIIELQYLLSTGIISFIPLSKIEPTTLVFSTDVGVCSTKFQSEEPKHTTVWDLPNSYFLSKIFWDFL